MIDTTANLVISKSNEVFLKVKTEPHIEYELRDHFKFEVPNAKFMPQYRGRNWNGEIHLYDMRSKQIYVGLLDKIVSFCKNYGYTYKFEDNKFYGTPYEENDFISMEGVKDYIKSISAYAPRQYQVEGVYDALKHNRRLLISPTASGKSLMIYSLATYYVEQGKNILVVVPTTSLVEQMYKDFGEYGWDSESYCHKIYSGREKNDDRPIVITTWQSIYKLERSWFEKFDVVIGDEAHLFKSKSLIQIMTKLHHAKYRFGFTGTLDGTQTHKWVLEGLFGPSYKVTRTEELMRQGHLSQLDIQCLVLKHPPQKFELALKSSNFYLALLHKNSENLVGFVRVTSDRGLNANLWDLVAEPGDQQEQYISIIVFKAIEIIRRELPGCSISVAAPLISINALKANGFLLDPNGIKTMGFKL